MEKLLLWIFKWQMGNILLLSSLTFSESYEQNQIILARSMSPWRKVMLLRHFYSWKQGVTNTFQLLYCIFVFQLLLWCCFNIHLLVLKSKAALFDKLTPKTHLRVISLPGNNEKKVYTRTWPNSGPPPFLKSVEIHFF